MSEDKDDKKFPFSIETDKEDIKLKLKKNVKKLADKFSWRRFFTKFLANKKLLVLMTIMVLGGAIFLAQVYDSNPVPDSTYQDQATIEEKIPGVQEKEKSDQIGETKVTKQKEKGVVNESQTEDKTVEDKMNEKVNKQESSVESQRVVQQAQPQMKFDLPVKGAEFDREYGWSKHPVLEDWRYHQGVDLAISQSAPIRAVAQGKVKEIREDKYLGLVLVLDHTNGYQTVYGHAQKFYVNKGKQVKRGQAIGEVGDSGLVMQPLLHFEIRQDEKTLNPAEYLDL